MGVFYKFQYTIQRRRFHKKAHGTPVQPLYERPLIKTSEPFKITRFLVLDCEMSGLDVKSSQLLSLGWVMVERGRIVNASGKHLLIHAESGTGDSSRIHGLLDSRIAGARSAAAALMLLIKQMQGAVLAFHHAPLDIRFLQKAALENFRCPLLFSYIDTMEIEKRRLQIQGKAMGLRLSQCRERYGLATTQQHNALADAQATAELLLAQASYMEKGHDLKLSELHIRCSK
ncbi:MAG: 3'-5' exonuclease [Gammaproteobacteria bacterium]|nr:3'-5' exonuclease [Gammaproteobacteria bacterium]